jgi:hypothetical protein
MGSNVEKLLYRSDVSHRNHILQRASGTLKIALIATKEVASEEDANSGLVVTLAGEFEDLEVAIDAVFRT